MESTDFEIDVRDFRQRMGTRRLDVNAANDHLGALVFKWTSHSTANFGGMVEIRKSDEGGRIDGEVLGKKFYIHYSPIGLEGDGAVEAALTLKNSITEGQVELARFLVTSEGVIQSVDGNKLADLGYSGTDLKLLVAVLNRVMNASALL